MMKRAGLMLLALMLIVAACGDDGGVDADALKSEIVAELTSDPSPADPASDPETAECLAAGIIDEIGAERVDELWNAAENPGELDEIGAGMTDGERETFTAEFVACVDDEVINGFAGAMFAAQGLGADVATCAVGNLAPEFVESLFGDIVMTGLSGEEFDPTGDQAVMTEILTAMNACTGG